ncbi:MAG TPA: DNA cytosine methyltransferase [Alphaproteobacteria bacterium]|nr:DNA cytosine methyltransferase [Alphaproteobacteria bacterium]
MKIAGLFAGIGGLELGLQLAGSGHETELLCDILPQSRAVLTERFGELDYHDDVTTLRSLPRSVDCITAGFPCQDLSQAGRTAGLAGERSGLIGEVFRLLRRRRIPTVLVENVPFMLQLGGGRAMRAIVDEFERLGYRWAYRVVDTWGFGLPQRRERVFLVASRELDPSAVLFADDAPTARPETAIGALAHGFYWTEGLGGLGWAVDAVPTLKNGSTIGIASPPAVLMPDGRIVRPSIEDAEALQGFPRGWTQPAERVVRPGYRWGLVGSAVSVPVASWLGRRLARPGEVIPGASRLSVPFPTEGKCPKAAKFDGKSRYSVQISTDPIGIRPIRLADFLQGPLEPLSAKATAGFYARTQRAKLRFEPGFLDAVRAHLRAMAVASCSEQKELALAA